MNRVLIIGGTGTLGQEIVKALSSKLIQEIRIFSRDELKQKQMSAHTPLNVTYRIGDVRDEKALSRAMYGIDTVFHVAALKHVDWAEENPEECVETNVRGTINVVNAAEASGVQHVIFSSTDKAVDPINVYGMSKAISERILLRRNEIQGMTKYSVYRWGNVLGSRGSVIPQFVKSLREHREVHLTNLSMTRFWITIQDAVQFMLQTYETCPRDRVNIPPIKGASLTRVVKAIANICGIPSYDSIVMGLRRGEKLHEALSSQHESRYVDSSNCEQYTDEELEGILAPLVDAA